MLCHKEIFLIRHCETVNPDGRFYGQKDVPLSAEGIVQSHKVAGFVSAREPDLVVSSDLSRCFFLADIIAKTLNLSVSIEPDFREADFGRWTGLTWKEIEKRYPEQAKAWICAPALNTPLEGESMSAVMERAVCAFLKLCRQDNVKRVAIVAHGGINRAILAFVLGMRLSCLFRLEQDFGCLNILHAYPNDEFSVKCVNMLLYES